MFKNRSWFLSIESFQSKILLRLLWLLDIWCRLSLLVINCIKKDIGFASLSTDGVFFNGNYFFNNEKHDQNVKIIVLPITSQMIHQEVVINAMFPAKNV